MAREMNTNYSGRLFKDIRVFPICLYYALKSSSHVNCNNI
jgi:hypothetical protein